MRTYLTIIFLLVQFNIVIAQELQITYVDANSALNTLSSNTGISVSNVTFTGAAEQLGTVTNSSGLIGFNNGIILSTGKAALAQTMNTSNDGDESPVESSVALDPDLTELLGTGQKKPATLEFDFVTTGSNVTFEFIFLSEEYNNFAPSDYHDGFGFFISGPGINGNFTNNAINIANVPNTSIPISVNTINFCTNSNFYRNNCRLNADGICIDQHDGNSACPVPNGGGSINNHNIPYNGFTTVLTAKLENLDCTLLNGATFHCKIALANFSDENYDSALILKAGTLKSDFSVGNINAFPQPVCEGQTLNLTMVGNSNYNYAWNTGQNGLGLSSISTIANPINNPYSVIVTNSQGCKITKSINAIIHSPVNIPPSVTGVNNSGAYTFYAQAGVNNCFNIQTFDTPGENVSFQLPITGLPAGVTSILISPQIAQFCWTPPQTAIGEFSFTVSFQDNNACGALSNEATFIIKIGCASCVPNVYYENRTPNSNPLPAYTKAGYGIYAGQSVDPSQIDGIVDVGLANVEFKAGAKIVLDVGFIGGPGFYGHIDPNTCITDCEDCCSHFPGITYDILPNVMTPNGDGDNDLWYLSDFNYPFCAYNAQAFDLKFFDRWGGLVFSKQLASTNCCPFRTRSSPNDPTIPTLSWNGVANHDVPYSWLDQLLGKTESESGSLVHDGQYFYTLELLGCNANKSFSGFIFINSGNSGMRVPAPLNESTNLIQRPENRKNSIINNNIESELFLYPNPTNGNLTVILSQERPESLGSIEIYNSLGQIIIKVNYTPNTPKEIDVSGIQNGIYSLRVNCNQNSLSKIFIKQ